MLTSIKMVIRALRKAFHLLQRKEPLVLSSSTAFFATFSLSPIIIILVSLFGIFAPAARLKHQLFSKIGATLGHETAREVENIVYNFLSIEINPWITICGLLFFVFVATTLLGVIKHAIQKIWHIRPKSKLKIKYHWRERSSHLGFILFTGALFLFSLLIDTSLGISLDYLRVTWPQAAIALVQVLNLLFSLIIITTWFTVLFKVLPEANIKWDTALNGGLLTGFLFSVGKFGLGKILVHAKFATVFGASSSFALLLLFIFYSSFILYYGAAFTHEYSEISDEHICAGKYADEYEERIIEGTRR